MKRRDFVKYGMGGLATLVLGSKMPWIMDNPAYAAVQTQTLTFTITDAVKEMVTHEPDNNTATCYFWIYKCDNPDFPPECPGPQIFCTVGDTIQITVNNALDEDHAFFIPGMVNTGPIPPGGTVTKTFTAPRAGTYLYFDNLNAPVNRMMGLHGALVVMPPNLHGTRSQGAHRLTPYSYPTPAVQALFDDFGKTPWWPGLAWEQGSPTTNTPAFRQYIWLCHQASPVLFAEVGNAAPGTGARIPANFMDAFINDPFLPTSNDPRLLLIQPQVPILDVFNRKPHFFTINGQSGHFSHNHPTITPMNRVGEPILIHVLNAGLMTHSMHMHANHFFITYVNGRVQPNLIWVDTYTARPMDIYHMVVPYMRPPDIPNTRGIGRADPGLTTLTGHPTWPPIDEFGVYHPKQGTTKQSFLNPGVTVDIAQRQSPLCYPMHDHSEASQTAQGGNYNCGLISGIYFIGDRNTPGQMNFPMDADFAMMLEMGSGAPVTGPAAGNAPA